MPVGAGIALVGLGTAAYQANEAGEAADQVAGGARQGLAEYQQYNAPFYNAGTSALSRLERLNSGDFSAFEESPDYRFAFDQGNEAILRGAASRGSLNSGGTDADLARFGQGLASQNYDRYYSRLAGLANLGANTAQGLGGQAVNAANTAAGAQAEGTINQANAYGNFASGLSGLYGQYAGAADAARRSSFQPQVERLPINTPQYNIPRGGYG